MPGRTYIIRFLFDVTDIVGVLCGLLKEYSLRIEALLFENLQ